MTLEELMKTFCECGVQLGFWVELKVGRPEVPVTYCASLWKRTEPSKRVDIRATFLPALIESVSRVTLEQIEKSETHPRQVPR